MTKRKQLKPELADLARLEHDNRAARRQRIGKLRGVPAESLHPKKKKMGMAYDRRRGKRCP